MLIFFKGFIDSFTSLQAEEKVRYGVIDVSQAFDDIFHDIL